MENLESRCLLSSIVDFPTPTTNSAPFAITSGPAGNVWFAETHVGKIGVINSTTDAISEFSLPTGASSADLLGITSGPDRNVWFTDGGNDAVGVINTTSHAITEYTVPTLDSLPFAITSGPGGDLWFTEQTAGKIGEFNPIEPRHNHGIHCPDERLLTGGYHGGA